MEMFIAAGVGAAAVGVGWFVWLGLKKGWSKATAKVSSMWNAGMNDVKGRVSKLEADVGSIKTKVGV